MNRHDSYRRIPRDWMVLLPIAFAPAIVGIALVIVLFIGLSVCVLLMLLAVVR